MARIPKRPGTITWAAVILFIVGGWSLLAGPCLVGSILVLAAIPEPPGAQGKAQVGDPAAPIRFQMKEVPYHNLFIFTNVGVNMLFGIGQIIGGIGLLRLSSTGRMFAVLVSVAKLLFAFAIHAFNVFAVMPVQERFYRENPHIPGGSFTGVFAYFTLGITVIIQIALFITIVALAYSPSAKAALSGAAAPPDEDEPRWRDEGYDDDYNPPGGSRETGIRE